MPQTQPYIVIYGRYQQFEVGNKYHFTNGIELAQNQADALVDAQAPLQHPNVQYTRWEAFSSSDRKIGEGALQGVGTAPGEMLPFKYCVHLRFNTIVSIKRPSYKMIHGITEVFTVGGEPDPSLINRLITYQALLKGAGVLSSDGEEISSVTFRNFSRRKRLRRIP